MSVRENGVAEKDELFRKGTFLTHRGIQVIEHPAYSPDLAPADFWLFRIIKDRLAGVPAGDESPESRLGRTIRTISKDEFSEAFQKWIWHWNLCIEKGGD